LYVGNAYPHKNLERLLDAFQQFHRTNVQLVLVGKQDYFYDRLRRFADKRGMRGILFTGEVTDSDLVCLYRGAIAYVFPSLYEGFGLPPFEAMAQGTPVIASDRAALPEVLGSAALYCNPEDVEDIAEKLRMIMDDTGLRTHAIEEGYRQVKKFSWKQLAERTRSVYESCEK
jgi:glycosyltransferase involved in cell wall biosynthesis